MRSLYTKNYKAFSLLEVLVMLTIISFTIIGAMNVVARVNVSVKNNEILDVVNDTLVKSLELAKSPSDLQITAAGLTALENDENFHYFALKGTGNTKHLQYDPSGSTTPFENCSVSSPYYLPVIVNEVERNYLVCLQYKIKRIDVSGPDYFEFEINSKYYLEEQLISQTLRTYRYGEFTGI